MKPPCTTNWLALAVTVPALALATASCGQQPAAPAPNQAGPGERHWVKIEEDLDDAAAQRALTQENVAKIHEGMPLGEVVQVLGVKPLVKKPAESGCWVTWQCKGKKVAVHLYYGKVSAKRQEGLD
jgi:hypothetical protein